MEASNSLGRENYPSIAKPWRKYYSEEALSAPLPQCTAYEYLHRANESCPHYTALNYFGRKISYGHLTRSHCKVDIEEMKRINRRLKEENDRF